MPFPSRAATYLLALCKQIYAKSTDPVLGRGDGLRSD
jgi:hypothetical protein